MSLSDPQYPIYVISKGRWDTSYTSRHLADMNVNHRVVIEPQELEQYTAALGRERLLVLPFSNLGQGSIPARNWVWEHSISSGHQWHWILDDNIQGFCRLHLNRRIPVKSGAAFRCIEDLAARYKTVAQAGMNYRFFADETSTRSPVTLNTRIYSCILIRNAMPHRWRGRYNEDTDLSLRFLKDGYATILVNAFLANKVGTMIMKGGNTDDLYKQDDNFDGRLAMAESLRDQHPDVVTITRKFNRWQHHVNYQPFKQNPLILDDSIARPERTANEYGLVLKQRHSDGWRVVDPLSVLAAH
jgi:hypothetical protein